MSPLSPGSLVIINLLGSVALLLWGVRMVRTGIVRAWGERLKRFIEARLKTLDWHQKKTATSLGIDRKTLYRKIREFGLAIDAAGSLAPAEEGD